MATRLLSDEQVEAFDVEFADGNRWETLLGRIACHFTGRPFTVLDVGGGNGQVVDRLLRAFPESSGVVLEPARLLLERNRGHARKRLIHGTAAELPDERFDLILVHWLLHHLVIGGYRRTCREQAETLAALRTHLTEGGRISVFENIYTGWVMEDLPGRLIYAGTALRIAAGLTGRLGANTAGVGVAFHSRHRWERMFRAVGLRVDTYTEPDGWTWQVRWAWRLGLTIRHIRTGHYWLAGG